MEKMPPKMHGGGKEAKDLESFPGGMPGPGKIISGSHSKGKFMATPKYKSEKAMPKYKEKGMPKSKNMVKGPDGKMVPDYAVDGKGSGDLAPKKYGDKKSMPAYKDKKSMPAYKDKKSMPKYSGKKPDSVSEIKKKAGLKNVSVVQKPEEFKKKMKK